MKTLTFQALIDTLSKVGLTSGDLVFVHSDLRPFGTPEKQQSKEEILQFYLDALFAVIGNDGTVAVPAYFYEFARFGKTFDVDNSPVSASLGSFSQWINTFPNRVRSLNPLQSIAAIGKRADELAGGDSLAGYGETSPWHRLRKMGGKLLFLGACLQSMTYIHYIEQQYGVPHLYFKIYPYPIIKNGKPLPQKAISAVRYLNFSVEYDLTRFQKRLESEKAVCSDLLNNGLIYVIEAESAFQIGITGLKETPYFFLKHPPKFIPDEVPIDGIIQM